MSDFDWISREFRWQTERIDDHFRTLTAKIDSLSKELARNLHDVASYEQVTEPLQRNGHSDSEESLATKNQVKGIRIMQRPWQPQDLLDDLQLLIDEEPDRYLNDRRTTLCMARDFLKEHFAEPNWVSVEERLPEESTEVLSFFCVRKIDGTWERYTATAIRLCDAKWLVSDYQNGIEAYSWGSDIEDCCFRVTHWMPLPEAPKEV